MKPIKRFKKEGNITYFRSNEEVLIPEIYQEKSEELRGVWFSTVANIDVEKMKDVESYQAYLLKVIQTVKEYHLNTIVFQVRPMNDAWYESKLNPWSVYITGTQGKYPGFDVFGWFVQEAKKENITIHAWINPYRVSGTKLTDLNMSKEEYLNTLDDKNFAKKNPDLVIETVESKLILDPSSEKVREFVSDTALEIATNYDVKAVHIDDYFYPYEEIKDPKEEAKCKASGLATLGEFRRDNVNRLIELIHNKFKTLDKKVEFGISPFGIYRTNSKWFEEELTESAWENGADNHNSCSTCYQRLYADIYLWMEKKWIDYVVPQDYWDLDYWKTPEDKEPFELVKYADVLKWWNWAAGQTNVKLYMGQGLYRVKDGDGNWGNPEEIANQIKLNHTFLNVQGTVFFTFKNFLTEGDAVLTATRKNLKELWTKSAKEV